MKTINKEDFDKNKINNLQFARKLNEEIESIITFDNYERVVNVYSTRNATIRKLISYLGFPDNVKKEENEIFYAEWNIPFDDRVRIRKALSINIYFLQQR